MLKSRLLVAVGIVAVVGGIAVLTAQTAASPAFDTASVKLNKSGDVRQTGVRLQPGGRFTATNVMLRPLISGAYGTPGPLPLFEVVGGPSWLDTDRFDVVAKASGDPQPGPDGPALEMLLMMRGQLLADRFHLAVHNESRELPVYALVLARSDGKMGEHLRVAGTACAGRLAAVRNSTSLPALAPGKVFCGLKSASGRLDGSGTNMASLTTALSQPLNRVVMDRTGLVGSYDFELDWTPDQMPLAPAGAPPAVPPDPLGASLFTALQEQLGLKLVSTTGPVDVLVIDHIEMPTPD